MSYRKKCKTCGRDYTGEAFDSSECPDCKRARAFQGGSDGDSGKKKGGCGQTLLGFIGLIIIIAIAIKACG